MTDPESQAEAFPTRWNTLGTGADLWATVVMAAGFVLPAGQTVREHYRIVRTLGQGGMGQVLGVMLGGSADAQLYALKMVARPVGAGETGKPVDPADLRDAEMQAKAFASLLRGEAAKQELVQRHGVSVARLFALVRFEDGSLGLRMEVARGRSLEEFLDEEQKERATQPPDVDFCLLVIRKVLYQLRRLHELVDPSSPSGFVHSDVKPGNVFVDDGDHYDPHITLLDFGVATAGHALGVDRSGRAAGRKSLILNDAGGTFGFAPPHHFTGKPTPLSDVYAALVILYELIALQSPWDFGALAKSPANLFKLEDAMRKGPRPVRSGRASVPEPVAEALDRFFADEFRALHALADRAHVARNAADDVVRTSMNDRLRTLAQGYQTKLEELRQQLTGGATRSSDPVVVVDASNTALARAPTEAQPKLPRRDQAATRVEVPSRAKVEPETVDSALVVSADDDDEGVRVPMRPLLGWKSALFVALIGGVCAWVWIAGVRTSVDQAMRAIESRVHGDSATPSSDAGRVANAVVAVDAGAASAMHLDAALAVASPDVTTHAGPDVAVAALVVDAAQITSSDVVAIVAAAEPSRDASTANAANVADDASLAQPAVAAVEPSDAGVAPIAVAPTPITASAAPAAGAHAVPPPVTPVANAATPPAVPVLAHAATPVHAPVVAHAATPVHAPVVAHAPVHVAPRAQHATPHTTAAHPAAHHPAPAHRAVHRPAPRPAAHHVATPAHRPRATSPRR